MIIEELISNLLIRRRELATIPKPKAQSSRDDIDLEYLPTAIEVITTLKGKADIINADSIGSNNRINCR